MTPEYRAQLLAGNGWDLPSVSTACPKRFADRIVEIRAAMVESRPIPQPSAEYRSWAAADFAKKRAPVLHPLTVTRKPAVTAQKTDAEIARSNGFTLEAYQDAKLRLRAKKLGEELRREAPALAATQKAEADAEEQRRWNAFKRSW